MELLFLRPDGAQVAEGERWEALARPSHRLRAGRAGHRCGDEEALILAERTDDGGWIVEGSPGRSLVALMERHGRLPLPPYIKNVSGTSRPATRPSTPPRRARRPRPRPVCTSPQVCWSTCERRASSSAYVTLHVGLDTFQPIREAVVEDHKIHREAFSVVGGSAGDHPHRTRIGAKTGGRGDHGHPGAGDGRGPRCCSTGLSVREAVERLHRHLHHPGLPFPGRRCASSPTSIFRAAPCWR